MVSGRRRRRRGQGRAGKGERAGEQHEGNAGKHGLLLCRRRMWQRLLQAGCLPEPPSRKPLRAGRQGCREQSAGIAGKRQAGAEESQAPWGPELADEYGAAVSFFLKKHDRIR